MAKKKKQVQRIIALRELLDANDAEYAEEKQAEELAARLPTVQALDALCAIDNILSAEDFEKNVEYMHRVNFRDGLVDLVIARYKAWRGVF